MRTDVEYKRDIEREMRNSYYNDYQRKQEDPMLDRITYNMYLIHDYAYRILCELTDKKYVYATEDWNAKHGIKRPENG